MKHNAKALDSFLKEKVEGNWESLVRLLCDPQSLSREMVPYDEITLLSDRNASRLEGAQRKAVIGAVTAPDTFFIQGPPGTGKTTVISEIIRELTHKGERILLLAPSHVAVDEVLRRIGDEPGILPVRLSFDDSKIDKDLRRFGESEVRRELAEKILKHRSKETEWQCEIDNLGTALKLILNILETKKNVVNAEEREQQCIKEYENWQSGPPSDCIVSIIQSQVGRR